MRRIGRAVVFLAGIAVAFPVFAGRNTAGTYSLPAGNPVVSGTSISSTWANNTLSDIAAEITDSLSRSGKGPMTAPLLTPDGTVAAPTHSFTSETGTGWWRNAAGDLRVSVLGVPRLQLSPAGVTLTSAVADGASAVGHTLDTTTTLANATATILSIRTGGTEQLRVDRVGAIKGPTADGASAVGIALDTVNALSNPTARLLSVRNNGVERVAVATDGTITAPNVWQRVVATADTTNSVAATPTNVAGLSFSAASGTKYLVRGRLFTYAAATTTGMGLSIKATGAPTTSTAFTHFSHWSSAAVQSTLATNGFTDTPGTIGNSTSVGGAGEADSFDAYFVTTGTGTIQLFLVTAVNASAVTVKAGSYLEYVAF